MDLRIVLLVLGCCAYSVSAGCDELQECRKVYNEYYKKSFLASGLVKFNTDREVICKDTSDMAECYMENHKSCYDRNALRAVEGTKDMREYLCSDEGEKALEAAASSSSTYKTKPDMTFELPRMNWECEEDVKIAYLRGKVSNSGPSNKYKDNNNYCRMIREIYNCYEVVAKKVGKEVAAFVDGMLSAGGIGIVKKDKSETRCFELKS